jgi:hypothetical protein
MIHIIGKDDLVHANNPLNSKIALCGYKGLTWPKGISARGRAWGEIKAPYNKKKTKL